MLGHFWDDTALIAARRVGSTGRVYAFEPDPRNFPFLVKNIAMNSMSDCVATFPYAVADTIERGSPRMAIFLECFPRGLWSAGASAWALLQWLERLGFSVLVIDERRRRLFPIKPTNRQLCRLHFNLLLPLGFW